MRLFSRDTPKIKVQTTKKDGFSGWVKCTECHEMVHDKELSENSQCCPKCNHHYRLSLQERLKLMVDAGSFTPLFSDITSLDPLDFVDTEPYKERLERAREKSGPDDSLLTGVGTLSTIPLAIALMNFQFMGGSMGSVCGEKLTRLVEYAEEKRLPLLVVTASGGARMQESIFSLMQMAKTSAALARFKESGLPYITLLTNPTSGGVTASFATLGDIILAEPGALICFAGPRVIEQTIRQKLPEGAQTAEFLLRHGMIDSIVKRHDLKKKIEELLSLLKSTK